MLNVQFVTQFAAFGAILAGFSMSIAFSILLHSSEKPKEKLEQFTAGAFLTSALILVLAAFLAALVLSVHAQNSVSLSGEDLIPETGSQAPLLVRSANALFYVIALGGVAMLTGLGDLLIPVVLGYARIVEVVIHRLN